MNDVRIALAGIGGYGNGYLDALLDHGTTLGTRLVGAIDPGPRACDRVAEVERSVGVIHRSLGEFFAAGGEADLVVISAPIHLHASLTLEALDHGAHVLCEKPAAGTIQEVRAMSDAAVRAGRSVAIGYQWSFSDTVQAIRRDVAAGRFGVPLQFRTLAFWPRPASYYGRSPWAGRLHGREDAWVLDSPVNNATAHYLHNMFFVLGAEHGRPQSVEAELYRANDIESFDTGALRVETAGGTEVLFLTTHAVPSRVGPVIHYRFTEADLYCNAPGHFFARFADGTITDYGSAEVTHLEKLERTVASIRAGEPPACSVDDASFQSLAVCGAHDSAPIVDFPVDLVRVDRTANDSLTWVDGLQDAFTQAFGQGILPAELESYPWTRAGRLVDLTGYTTYPSAMT